MITVAIVAILATIAYPSYSQYIARSNRAAAESFMLDVANKQEQYRLDARQYASSLATLYGVASDAAATPSDVSKHYTVAV
jgi:type IV pilus assembly protein PilE